VCTLTKHKDAHRCRLGGRGGDGGPPSAASRPSPCLPMACTAALPVPDHCKPIRTISSSLSTDPQPFATRRLYTPESSVIPVPHQIAADQEMYPKNLERYKHLLYRIVLVVSCHGRDGKHECMPPAMHSTNSNATHLKNRRSVASGPRLHSRLSREPGGAGRSCV